MFVAEATPTDRAGNKHAHTGITFKFITKFSILLSITFLLHVQLYFSSILEKCLVDADFKLGDADGGWDKQINGRPTSATKCARMVKEKEPTANGATYEPFRNWDMGLCWAEFDATSYGQPTSNRRTCLFSSKVKDSKYIKEFYITLNV